jgi:hypothetical protein
MSVDAAAGDRYFFVLLLSTLHSVEDDEGRRGWRTMVVLTTSLKIGRGFSLNKTGCSVTAIL